VKCVNEQPIGLDDIARDPGRVADLTREQWAALLLRNAVVQSALAARPVIDKDTTSAPSDRTLSTDEIAAALGVSRRWLFAAARAGRLPFVKRVSKKSLLAARADVERWLKSRGSR
jgi:excisionase family DNA binding protein